MSTDSACHYCPCYSPKGRWKSKFQVQKRKVKQELIASYIECVCLGGEKKEIIEKLLETMGKTKKGIRNEKREAKKTKSPSKSVR